MADYKFGTKEYFDRLYLTSEEPWGISFRASQQYRYNFYIQILKEFSSNHESVLDIGCSQGQFTIMLRDIASQIIGIDISQTAIERAEEKYRHYKKIKFQVGNLPLLKYNNDSFDLVSALEVLYYLGYSERKQALEEIKRILKKEGFLLISVNIGHPPYFQTEEFYNLINSFFLIKKVEYYYGKIYSFFETKLLLLERTIFKKIIRFFLSINRLVEVGQFLTKSLLGRKGITIMCVLAQKTNLK